MSLKRILLLKEISDAKNKALQKKILTKLEKLFKSVYADIWDYEGNEYKDPEEMSKDLLNFFQRIDPTDNGKYLNWIIRWFFSREDKISREYVNELQKYYSDGHEKISFQKHMAYDFLPEDISKFRRNLKVFTIAKDRNVLSGNKADINQYKSFDDIFNVIKPYLDDPDFQGTNKEVIMKESEIIYDDNGWKIVKPETHRASCFWGSGTNWCTAVDDGDSGTFDAYKEGGDLYILIREKSAKKEKFQLHWDTSGQSALLQFMNAEDEEAFDEFLKLMSKELFADLIGVCVYDMEKDPMEIVELLYNFDSLVDHVNDYVSPPFIWSDFIPMSSHYIIIEILREYLKGRIEFRDSSTREGDGSNFFNNSEKILAQFFKDGEDKDKENFLEFLTSDVGGSKIIFWIEESKRTNINDGHKLYRELENDVIKYYKGLMK